jgi:hypothetical protein
MFVKIIIFHDNEKQPSIILKIQIFLYSLKHFTLEINTHRSPNTELSLTINKIYVPKIMIESIEIVFHS